MSQFLNLGFIAIGFFALVSVALALMFVGKGKLEMPQVKIAYNFTKAYRAGGFKKFLYFFIPVSAFIFFSVFGGLALMIASWLGVTFSKRYEKATADAPEAPLAATVSHG